MKKAQKLEIGDVKIVIYNTPDNKTVDIVQDTDKLVLTHEQAKKVALIIIESLS